MKAIRNVSDSPGRISIGIIGAGTMGSGIAISAADAGFDVHLADATEDFLDRGLARIYDYADNQVERGRLTAEERDRLLGRIEGSFGDPNVGACDLVIEAVPEQLRIKQPVYESLNAVVADDTIIASNTSSLAISELARSVNNPARFVGMHFFNPVPKMALVEVIAGEQTSDETIARTVDIARQMGKTPVVVKDSPGFVANRLLIPMINDAINLLDAGVASAEDIDTVMKLGASHPMGPLALADLIGLDVCLDIMNALHDSLGDCQTPAPLLAGKVAEGHLGRKSGQGFFAYDMNGGGR